MWIRSANKRARASRRRGADVCPSALPATFLTALVALAAFAPGAGAAGLPFWPPAEFPLEPPGGSQCRAPSEPPPEGCPNTVTVGPDGALWLLEFWGSRLTRMTTEGEVTLSEPTPTPGAQPEKIVLGPEGDLWFSEYAANQIGRARFEDGELTEIVEYPVEAAPGGPVGVAAGPDGKVWFVTQEGGTVGRIDPDSGEVDEFEIPGAEPKPFGIAAGPDGAMWFTQQVENQIGRIPLDADPDGPSEIEEFPIGVSPWALYAADIVLGPDGAMWFVEAVGEQVGRIDPDEPVVEEFPMPACATVACGAYWLAPGHDGNVWFTAWGAEPESNWVGRASPDGEVTMEALETPDSQPYGIAPGTDCDVWFTEFTANAMANLETGCAAPLFVAEPGALDFGSRQVGAGPSAPRAVTVGNDGPVPMRLGAVSVAGPGWESFSIAPDGDRCSGVTLYVGDRCTVELSFVPVAGGAAAAALAFSGEAAGGVALTGTGILPDPPDPPNPPQDPPNPPSPGPGPPPLVVDPPRVEGLRVTPRQVTSAGVATIRFRADRRVKVAIEVAREGPGGPARQAAFSRWAREGANAIRYRTSVRRRGGLRPLPPGRYVVSLRVAAEAADPAPLRHRFRIVRR